MNAPGQLWVHIYSPRRSQVLPRHPSQIQFAAIAAFAITAVRADTVIEVSPESFTLKTKHFEVSPGFWPSACTENGGCDWPAMKGKAVIRQSIFCDVCGAQRREANHWFVAYEEAGELRVSSWASSRLLSAGTKHVCGERCTHKLMSEFLARATTAGSIQPAAHAGLNDLASAVHSGEPLKQRRPAQMITLPRLAYSPSHAPIDDQHRGTGRRTS